MQRNKKETNRVRWDRSRPFGSRTAHTVTSFILDVLLDNVMQQQSIDSIVEDQVFVQKEEEDQDE